MIGAIDFMRAWRDVCTVNAVDNDLGCRECKLDKLCGSVIPFEYTDAGINDLITAVMAEKARRERNAKD